MVYVLCCDIVLIVETFKGVNKQLEAWRHVLESKNVLG